MRKQISFAVLLRQQQSGEENLIKDSFDRAGGYKALNQFRRLIGIVSQQPLIVGRGTGKRRLIAKEQRENVQGGHVPSKHDQTRRQWRRQQQPHRSPEPSPKHGRDQQRELGHADAMPEYQRLNEIAVNQFQREKVPDHQKERREARLDGKGKDRWKEYRDPGAQIRHI